MISSEGISSDRAQLSQHSTTESLALDRAWIYTGPVYSTTIVPFAPRRTVPRPNAFYKIVVAEGENGGVDVLAFLMPHNPIPRQARIADYLTTIDIIDALTDIDFLHELPDSVEDAIERRRWELWPDVPDVGKGHANIID